MKGTLGAQVNGTSSDENGTLSTATVTTTEVVLTVGFLIAMIVASVSAISCVVVVVTRKRRRSTHNQDESGPRVVCMVCLDKFPSALSPAHASITQKKSDQAYNHSNTLKVITVNEIKSPQNRFMSGARMG